MADAPMVFNLTDMIGRASGKDRTAIVATFELPRRYLTAILVAFIPSVMLAAMLVPLLGAWSLAFVIIFETVGLFLYEHRQSSGLHLRTYQAIIDRYKARLGKIVVCGQDTEVDSALLFFLVPGSLPVSWVGKET